MKEQHAAFNAPFNDTPPPSFTAHFPLTGARPFIPTATYRLQFRKEFTFAHADALSDYLRELGVSHVYASPIFRAAPGSAHGYDICDHNLLNPEIGSREHFDAFVGHLRDRGLGLIVDFVPNHMGIAEPHNAWWMDVLEHGPSSPYASYFDIDWRPLKRELENKVLLPILGDQYGRVLEKGELRLVFADGAFTVRYFDTVLPIEPSSTRIILQGGSSSCAARRRRKPCVNWKASLRRLLTSRCARTRAPRKLSSVPASNT